MSAKLLLVLTGSNTFNAQALVVTEGGLYQRPLADEAEFTAVYQTEKFDLIVCDGRGTETALLELTERIRSHQLDAHIVLVCEKPPLDFVIKAIRLGVRDLFPTPVNLGGLLTRADELIKPFFKGGGATALGNCRSSLTLFLTADGRPSAPVAVKGANAADAKELNTLRLECDRLGRELQAAQEAHNLSATTQVSRSQDIEAREQALAEMESVIALDKNKLLAEIESVKMVRSELEQGQVAAGKVAAELAEREEKLALATAGQSQAQQAHEEAQAEFEVSEQMLAAREKALAAERIKFEEAQKNLPQAQARLAQESAELATQRQSFLIEQAALTNARAEHAAQQSKLSSELVRIESEANELDGEKAEVGEQRADLVNREKILLGQTEKCAERERVVGVAELKMDSTKVTLLADQSRLANELAAVERAKAEQSTAQAQAKAERAELQSLKAKVAAESARLDADAAGLDESKAELAAQAADFKKREQVITGQERALVAREVALSEAEGRVALIESNARASVAPLVAAAEARAAALDAREKLLVTNEKEVTKLLARLEADAAAAEEEQVVLAAAKGTFDKASAGLASREAKLALTEKLHAEQAVQINKELAALLNQQQLIEADRQALEEENNALVEKAALLEKKRLTMKSLISSV